MSTTHTHLAYMTVYNERVFPPKWWRPIPHPLTPFPLPHPVLYLPGFPDYGFYSAPSDQRGAPCSFADYGSLGPQAAQMLQSEHATSACNSPLQHLHSPDQFKSPGLYGAFLPFVFFCFFLSSIWFCFVFFLLSFGHILHKQDTSFILFVFI